MPVLTLDAADEAILRELLYELTQEEGGPVEAERLMLVGYLMERLRAVPLAYDWTVDLNPDEPRVASDLFINRYHDLVRQDVFQEIPADITTLTTLGALDAANDWVLVYDADDAANPYKKVHPSDIDTDTVYTHPNHSGHVTSVGDGATTIQAGVVTNAMLASMTGPTFKGRETGSGDPQDLTATQATSMLNVFTETLKGLVPLSGGGTANFLRADGTWTPPPGGGGGNSFETWTVAADSGFTWADTGSVVADSATDTVQLVEGTDIDIDVDAALDAVRISFTNASGYITGNETITLSGNVTGSGATSISTTIAALAVATGMIQNDAVTYAKMQNVVANNVILGNNAGAGQPVDELSATEVRTLINVADGANNYTHPNHTGHVTSVGDGATTIASNVVANSMIADMAAYTFKMRNAGTSGAPSDITINSLTADGTPVGSTDYVMTWDADTATHKKVLLDNLPGGGGGVSSTGGGYATDEIVVYASATGSSIKTSNLQITPSGDFKVNATTYFQNLADASSIFAMVGTALGKNYLTAYAATTSNSPTLAVTSDDASSPLDLLVTTIGTGTLKVNGTAVLLAGGVTPADDFDTTVPVTKGGTGLSTISTSQFIYGSSADNMATAKISAFTEETAPAAGDWLLGEESGGAIRKFDIKRLVGTPVVHPHSISTDNNTGAVGMGFYGSAANAFGKDYGVILRSVATPRTIFLRFHIPNVLPVMTPKLKATWLSDTASTSLYYNVYSAVGGDDVNLATASQTTEATGTSVTWGTGDGDKQKINKTTLGVTLVAGDVLAIEITTTASSSSSMDVCGNFALVWE